MKVTGGATAGFAAARFRARLRRRIAAISRYAQPTTATAEAATDDQNKITPWLGRCGSAGRWGRAPVRARARVIRGGSGASGPTPASARREGQARRAPDRRPALRGKTRSPAPAEFAIP